MTVAQSRESKFFLSQFPVSGLQNLHPNKFIPRILNIKMKSINKPKNTATLSIVLNITINDLCRFGKNLIKEGGRIMDN